ncbi:hypothetical protein, partial [Escherichia coli]|uniref:hypothetical protein n=1 Tax=Escherichia coli TaxID=562 RepID=UPI00195F61E2
ARILVTSLMNLLVLWWLFPFFLDLAANYLKATIGFQADSPYLVLLVTLVFTAVFNILHSLLSIIPSYFLIVKAVIRVRSTNLKKPWLQQVLEADSKRL